MGNKQQRNSVKILKIVFCNFLLNRKPAQGEGRSQLTIHLNKNAILLVIAVATLPQKDLSCATSNAGSSGLLTGSTSPETGRVPNRNAAGDTLERRSLTDFYHFFLKNPLLFLTVQFPTTISLVSSVVNQHLMFVQMIREVN